MKPETLLACIQAIDNLIGTKYHIHLGRAGKLAAFTITFKKEDVYHLMGLHYLQDRIDNRNRGKIFDSLLTDPIYRHRIASSSHWSEDLSSRVACATMLEKMLDDNSTVFRYNHKRLPFFSQIEAEYLLDNTSYGREVYLFIDKREDSDDRFCRSIFPKTTHDYSYGQAKWTLLYKKKHLPDGTEFVLYHNKNYVLPNAL